MYCIAFVKHLQYFWANKTRRLKSLGLCTDLVFFYRLWMRLHNNWEILVRLLIITARRFHGQDGRAGFWWKCSGVWCVGALLNNSHQIIILKCPEKCHQTSIQLACEDRANNYIYLWTQLTCYRTSFPWQDVPHVCMAHRCPSILKKKTKISFHNYKFDRFILENVCYSRHLFSL